MEIEKIRKNKGVTEPQYLEIESLSNSDRDSLADKCQPHIGSTLSNAKGELSSSNGKFSSLTSFVNKQYMNDDEQCISFERSMRDFITEGYNPFTVAQEQLCPQRERYNTIMAECVNQIKSLRDTYRSMLEEQSRDVRKYWDHQQERHILEIERLKRTLDVTEMSLALLQSRYRILFDTDIVRRYFKSWSDIFSKRRTSHGPTANPLQSWRNEASNDTREGSTVTMPAIGEHPSHVQPLSNIQSHSYWNIINSPLMRKNAYKTANNGITSPSNISVDNISVDFPSCNHTIEESQRRIQHDKDKYIVRDTETGYGGNGSAPVSSVANSPSGTAICVNDSIRRDFEDNDRCHSFTPNSMHSSTTTPIHDDCNKNMDVEDPVKKLSLQSTRKRECAFLNISKTSSGSNARRPRTNIAELIKGELLSSRLRQEMILLDNAEPSLAHPSDDISTDGIPVSPGKVVLAGFPTDSTAAFSSAVGTPRESGGHMSVGVNSSFMRTASSNFSNISHGSPEPHTCFTMQVGESSAAALESLLNIHDRGRCQTRVPVYSSFSAANDITVGNSNNNIMGNVKEPDQYISVSDTNSESDGSESLLAKLKGTTAVATEMILQQRTRKALDIRMRRGKPSPGVLKQEVPSSLSSVTASNLSDSGATSPASEALITISLNVSSIAPPIDQDTPLRRLSCTLTPVDHSSPFPLIP